LWRRWESNPRPLDTLAQKTPHSQTKKSVLLKGNGSDLSDTKALQGRAKRKLISQSLALSLIDIAKENEDNESLKSFWNFYHCQNKLHTHNNRIHGNYCKSHICPICCANRKADLINRYLPVVLSWPDQQFLTLTSRSVKEKYLSRNLDGSIRALSQILKKQRQKAYKEKGKAFVGIRSIECNFNSVKKTYNPHIHLLLPDKETAEAIRTEWLKKWTKKHTIPIAQYIRPVRKVEEDLIEIIKYGSKIFIEPDMKKNKDNKTPPMIYARALYNIFRAMSGRRLFQNFGFDMPKIQRVVNEPFFAYDAPEWQYDLTQSSWISTETGKLLFEPEINAKLEFLLHNNINKSED